MTDDSPTGEPPRTTSELWVLMFTDVVGSTALKRELGVDAYTGLIGRHDAIFREVLAACPGGRILQDTGDGYFLAFNTVTAAVGVALLFQHLMRQERWPRPFEARVGIHLGQVAQVANEATGQPRFVASAIDLASRVMSLARGGQILMTRTLFDEARQLVRSHPRPPAAGGRPGLGHDDEAAAAATTDAAGLPLTWAAHGPYLFKGADEPMDVFEVGVDGAAPLAPPPDSEKAKRHIRPGDDQTLGWRPAVGLHLPGGPQWVVTEKLGEGGFGEVWLVEHRKTRAARVFKFCFDAERLRALKREVVLFRLLKQALGERRDIAVVKDFQLADSPYYIETEYTPGGNLDQWAEKRGGIRTVPLADRVRVVAQTAEALAAAHSVGILHKDIKPSNILIASDAPGTFYPRLADFGIGVLTERSRLADFNITAAGFTSSNVTVNDSSRTGTRMYAPPESLMDRPHTVQGDVYAMGVLLYQMYVGDLRGPLAPGWERHVDDPLVREDVAACVEGDPALRLGSAGELAQRLGDLEARRAAGRERERLLAEAEAAARRAADATRLAQRRRVVIRLMTVALAVLGLLLAVIATLWREVDRQKREAQASEGTAKAQAAAAEAARSAARDHARRAELRLADGLVSQGDALAQAGRWLDARGRYLEASDGYARHAEPPFPAALGLFRLHRSFNRELVTLPGHRAGVLGVAMTPDGRSAVSASSDHTLKVWDVPTGRELRTLAGHGSGVSGVGLTADGRVALSGSLDTTLKVWDVATGRELKTLSGHAAVVLCVALTPDGRHAVSGSSDRTVKVWDVAAGREQHTLTGHADGVTAVAVTPDAKYAVSGSLDKTLKVWDVATGRELVTLAGHKYGVYGAAVTADGRRVVSGSSDHTLKVWDVAAGRELRTLSGHSSAILGVALTADGRHAVSSSYDHTLRVWDLAGGRHRGTLAGHTAEVTGVAVSADGRSVVSGSADKTLKTWGVSVDRDPGTLAGHTGRVSAAAVTPDGRYVVSGGADHTLRVWDAATGRELVTLAGHAEEVSGVAVTADGRVAVSGSADKSLKVWDVAAGREVKTLVGHAFGVTAVALSGDGGTVVSGSYDNTLKVWDAAAGRELKTLAGHGAAVLCVALSPDGRHVASGGLDRSVKWWDVSAARELKTLAGHGGGAGGVAVTSDGHQVLSGGGDRTLKVWDLASGRAVRTLTGHAGDVTSVSHTADGRYALSGGFDKAVKAWDVATGRELATLGGHTDRVYAVAVTPDGRHGVSGGSDNKVKVWDFSRAARQVEFEGRLPSVREALQRDPADAAAAVALGEWYAFRGKDDWAVEQFERARAAGARPPALTLGRCYWGLGRTDDARRELAAALDQAGEERERFYLRLCVGALARAAAAQPHPGAATAPAPVPGATGSHAAP